MPNLQCSHCGSAYYARPSTIAQGFGKYCSKRCSNTASNPALALKIPDEVEQQIVDAYLSGKSKHETGLLFGFGRGGVDKVLKRRGIQPRTLSQALKNRVFTDEHRAKIKATHRDVSGANNPMHGKTPGHGKRIYVDHLDRFVRSTWEATVALALHVEGIPHEYESRRIELSGMTYLPDFYLPGTDTYIEVKGWPNARYWRMREALSQERPDIRLFVIRQAEYNRIKAEPCLIAAMLEAWLP